MLKKHVFLIGAVWLLCLGDLAYGAHNPGGWIQTSGWNFLLPLNQGTSCDGGGPKNMRDGKWLAPYDLGVEDPQSGTEWTVDFNATAITQGWGLTGLGLANPYWLDYETIKAYGTPPNGDVFDMNALVDWLNANGAPTTAIPNDNVVGFATTYVDNKTGATLEANVCSSADDSCQVWVNDQIVMTQSYCRGWYTDCQEQTRVYFRPGVNKIAVGAWEGGGGWGFRLAVLKKDGCTKYTDADVSELEVLGPVLPALAKTPVGYSSTRTVSSPVGGPGAPVTVTVKGAGAAGALTDQLTVVERITKGEESGTLTISDISNSGAIAQQPSTLGPFEARMTIAHDETTRPQEGENWRYATDKRLSDTSWDPVNKEYSSTARTGDDIWDSGDNFEFAYAKVPPGADFDVSMKFTGKQHESGFGRWGKHGIMAREVLGPCGRYTMMQGAIPVCDDGRRIARRRQFGAGNCGDMAEAANFPGQPNQPTYFRLTRRGNLIQGWSSVNPAVEADPGNDANWQACMDDWGVGNFSPGPAGGDDWGGSPEVYVGYANSEHNSSDLVVQSMQFKVLRAAAGAPGDLQPLSTEGPIPGQKTTFVKWDVTRADLNAGISYKVNYSGGPVYFAKAGQVLGESDTQGTKSLQFASGEFETFDYALDIGEPPTAGSTTETGAGAYTVFGAGQNLWEEGDDFQFAYKTVTGDFEMTAHVANRAPNPAGYRWGRHGIMARVDTSRACRMTLVETMLPTLDTNGDAIADAVEDNPRHHVRYMDKFRGYNWEYQYLDVDATQFATEGWAPTWMRLVRQGNTLHSFLAEDADADGLPDKWCLLGVDNGSEGNAMSRDAGEVGSYRGQDGVGDYGTLPATLLVGLAMQGRVPTGGSADFDQVSIEPIVGPNLVTTKGAYMTGDDYNSTADGEPPINGLVAERGGSFMPAVYGNRLRLTEDNIAGSATAVWYGMAGSSILTSDGFIAEFDAYMSKPFGGVDPADGMTFAMVQGTAAELLLAPGGPSGTLVGLLDKAQLVGTDASGASQGTYNSTTEVYTSVNGSGLDIWTGGDDFMYQYADVPSGDFDIAMEFVSYTHSTGTGRWGKFGLMARASLDRCARFTMAQAHGPAEPDPARQAGRNTDLNCGAMYETLFGTQAGTLPKFLRLTRRGNIMLAWASNQAGLGDGTLDPRADANWTAVGSNDDWGASPAVLVGFANSEHGDAGAGVQTIEFKLLKAGGGVLPWRTVYCGDGGGALGFDGGYIRDECHPSFAIEFDNWYGGGTPGNEPAIDGSSGYDPSIHVGLDFNGNVSSSQTSTDLGLRGRDLPNIFDANGVHVVVTYLNTGKIDVTMAQNPDGTPVKVIDAAMPPLVGDVVLGFTGGTGGATCRQEIDNVALYSVCSEVADSVEITGDPDADVGDPVTLTATMFGVDGTASYTWSIEAGPAGASLSATTGASVDLTSTDAGTVTVKVVAQDSACGNTVEDTIDVEFKTTGGIQQAGDTDQDGTLLITDPIRLLNYLFLGTVADLPCGSNAQVGWTAGDIALLDVNGSNPPAVDLSDAVYVLNYLFLGSKAPVQCVPVGDEVCPCIRIAGCPDNPKGNCAPP